MQEAIKGGETNYVWCGKVLTRLRRADPVRIPLAAASFKEGLQAGFSVIRVTSTWGVSLHRRTQIGGLHTVVPCSIPPKMPPTKRRRIVALSGPIPARTSPSVECTAANI